MKYAIAYSLGCPQDAEEALHGCYRLNGRCAVSILIASRPGVISVYEGLDEIKKIPGVVTVAPKAHVGSVIPDSGDVKQRIAEVGILVKDDKQTIEETVLAVQSLMKVLDENGENMLISMVDPRQFR